MKPICTLALLLLAACPVFPQAGLKMPTVRGGRSAPAAPAPPVAPVIPVAPAGVSAAYDPVFRFGYGSKREAAAAALLAGVDAAEIGHRNERAMALFLMSVERDPSYSRAIYNLGVISAALGSWDDALNFYKEARRVDPASDVMNLIDQDTARVEAIAQMESTPDGKIRRRFDVKLLEAVQKLNDPAIAADTAAGLMKADPGRWEAPALAGMAQASLGQFADSAKSFEAAARLAPPDRRPQLATAADLASREGQYLKLMEDADAANDKKDYSDAAKMYADAWELSPGRSQTGMQAAITFMMADEVPLAVQTLSRLLVSGTPETSEKAGLMLKELGEFSPDAKTAAQQTRSGDVAPIVDVAERVRTEIGDLRSPEMKVAGATPTKLVRDDLKFIRVADDQVSNPKELLIQSTETLFAIYQRTVGAPGGAGSYATGYTPVAPAAGINPLDATTPAVAQPGPAPSSDGPPATPVLPGVRRPGGFAPRPGDNSPQAPAPPPPPAADLRPITKITGLG